MLAGGGSPPLQYLLEIRNFRGLQLKLELVCNQGDEFGIRGFPLGIADGIAEKSLECVQITTIPGYFDGVPDGPFHPAGRSLKGLGYLRVEHLGDGIGVPYGPPGIFQKKNDSLHCLFL